MVIKPYYIQAEGHSTIQINQGQTMTDMCLMTQDIQVDRAIAVCDRSYNPNDEIGNNAAMDPATAWMLPILY